MLEFREVQPDKFEEIWPFLEEIVKAGETYPYPMDTTFEQGKSFWFAPGARVYNAYLNGLIVASRYLVPNKPGLGRHICNTGVMIDKRFRGQGLGKQMMRFAIEKSKELGYKAIQLNLVAVTNKVSIKICKEFGFEVIGELPGAFFLRQEKYVNAYVMFKKL